MASEVKRLFEGSWSCYKSENVDAIMDKMNVPEANRAAWDSNAVKTIITVSGEEIIMSGKAGPHVPEANRAAWGSNDVTTTITVDGEQITMSGKAGPRDYTVSFELGQDFKLDGGMMDKGNSEFSGGVFKTVLTPVDKTLPKQTVSRRIVDGKMVQTQEIEGVVSTRYFKSK